MPADLRSQLEASLGATYSLDRELGGGGMSRVFVAREVALDRSVVIKVMSPELAAGVNVDRFNREIQLAAQLQHPHVVPVLAAGVVGDLPYYTMPFIEGESLRDRLARSGELPIADACRILREVCDALDCAHARGVVHRDIKPENILLSRQHALVSDFGVAKALSTATRSGGTLTDIGLALGTPAYMAPEQAAAEPTVDHRADIYALGVVAYEMFAGHAPFAGRTPQALLKAQIIERPVDVATLRASLPRQLAELVMRCLEKSPGDRPQSALGIITEIDAISLEAGSGAKAQVDVSRASPGASDTRSRLSSRRALIGAFALLVVISIAYPAIRAAGLGPGASLFGAGVMKERDKVIVADFQHVGADSTLGAVVSSALRTDLSQSKVISVAQSSEVADVILRMQRPADTPLTPAIAREVAVREGYKVVVEGDIAKVADSYVLTARLVSPAEGKVLGSFRESATTSSDIIPAIDRLTGNVRQKIGESVRSVRASPPLWKVSTSSIDALRKYVQAGQAIQNGSDYTRAFALLDEAIALDSNFAAAYSFYALALFNRSMRPAEAERMREKAYQLRDRLTEVERYRVTAGYYNPIGGRYDRQKVLAAYRSLIEMDSSWANPFNELGQLYRFERDLPRAAEYYAAALKRDSTSTVVYSNLGAMLFGMGRTAEAGLVYKRMAERFPNDPIVVRRLADFAVGRFLLDSARMYAKQIIALRPGDPIFRRESNAVLIGIAGLTGKITERDRVLNASLANAIEARNPEDVFGIRLSLATSELRFRRNPSAALAIVRTALKDHPPADSTGRLRSGNLTLASLYARAGLPDLATDVMRRSASVHDTVTDQRVIRAIELARGEIALAQNRPMDAITHFRRADVGSCIICLLPEFARAYARAGQTDSAVAYYQRYVTTQYAGAVLNYGTEYAEAHQRLGELYEERGDLANAERHYTRFVELWNDADPDLQPRVAAVRRRLDIIRRKTG